MIGLAMVMIGGMDALRFGLTGSWTGFDLPVIRAMAEVCSAEIVASGGAGKMEHFYDAVEAGATILLAASVFHFHIIDIPELKDYLRGRGLELM